MLRREPVTIETQGGWREAFAPATGSRIWGGRPHGRKAPITRKGLIEMLDKNVEEEQAPRVDERLARVARIIVEQYDGDVKAFVDSIRYRTEVNRKAEAASDQGDEALLRKCPSTTKIIGRISSAHYS
jgi:hypothetical protein